MNLQIPAIPADLIRCLNEHDYEAYVVGGCVRDALMGISPHDWDICTNASPCQVIDVFSHLPVVKTGLQHGTVTVIQEEEGYEITTFRTDGDYSDHRHPDQVTFVSDLREDLARRDFTINAMAYHPEQGLQDYFDGQGDLTRGLIRCVGQAEQRFEEDGLRILRALRFAARFGFAIEEETGKAMHRCAHLLEHIARERIFTELKGFLVGKGVGALLREYRDIFARILPPLSAMFDFDQRNPHHCHDVWEHTVAALESSDPELVLRLSLLFHDCGKPASFSVDENGTGHFYGHGEQSLKLTAKMLSSLRCDNLLRDQVLLQVEHHDLPLPQTPREGRRFLNKLGKEGAFWSLEVHRADYMGQAPQLRPEKLARYARAKEILGKLLEEETCFSLKQLAVSGRDLIALGYQPGPSLGRALSGLLEAVLEGDCPNDRSALLSLAQLRQKTSFDA